MVVPVMCLRFQKKTSLNWSNQIIVDFDHNPLGVFLEDAQIFIIVEDFLKIVHKIDAMLISLLNWAMNDCSLMGKSERIV